MNNGMKQLAITLSGAVGICTIGAAVENLEGWTAGESTSMIWRGLLVGCAVGSVFILNKVAKRIIPSEEVKQ